MLLCGRRARVRRGPDVWASVSPTGQILASLAVLVTVALSGLALFAFAPGSWWLFTTYFWVSFPAFGLLTRGLSGLSGSGRPSAGGKERELLEALRGHGELTPARAAMETSMTVAQADGLLKGLAEGGHLEVKARGGALYYALWEAQDAGGAPGAIREQYGGLKLMEPDGDRARQDLERSGT